MFAAAAIAANSAGFNVCGNQRTRISFSMRRVTARHRSLAINNNKNLESESHQNEQQQDEEEDHVENSLGVEAALSMLRFYKREISPLLPNSCRYVPTCSEYSMEAYKKYGVVKGTVLTAWRLCRCNPLGNVGLASILRDGLMRILLFKKNEMRRESQF
ncbi:hypothetical protein NC653_036612 [Populus alba x Populus x berolinensis]|uniref:Uncharacterized protein n=1 Tax=Populus alba x Populus x berolinensis TaxID=444605 RepID=A0AAD6LKI7_9ROSI|nr:hypothetical protein NC653_036612 [Populus alba x Populus x berolinensis]